MTKKSKYKEHINISENVNLPKSFVTEVDFIVGVRKYGKSYTVGLIEEEFQIANWPFLVIDPMGIHYALRQTYNNVVIVGGPHQDVEITNDVIYDIIEQRVNVVFDLSEYEQPSQLEIAAIILEKLREWNRDPLKIIIEESDLFTPQRGGHKYCKELINWLVRKGRQNGIGMTLMSQRFTSIDKEVLTQVDNYFIFKMTSPSDIPTLKKFIPKEAVDALYTFKPGDCFMLSHHHTGMVKIKKRRNEHQGNTPVLGEKRKPIRLRKLRPALYARLHPGFLERAVLKFNKVFEI